MTEEKKDYKKTKACEKSSLDKRKHNPECKQKQLSQHTESQKTEMRVVF